MERWDLEVDAVVVGAGACGLTAASRLAKAGLDVVIVEKTGTISGNTALSQGMIPAAGTRFQREAGIPDSPQQLYEDIMRKNGGTSNPDVTRTVSHFAREAVEWLVDGCNVDLSLCMEFHYPGFSYYRMHAPPSRSGRDLLQGLLTHIKQQPNVTLALHAPVTSIIPDQDAPTRVNGVRITQADADICVKARAVILASNGFGANKGMVKAYIPQMADALYFGHEGNTGDALIQAGHIGAAWSSMSGFQGHASVAVPHGILITWGTVMTGGILLNRLGKRFTNELQGYSEMSLEVIAQPNGLAFELFDEVSHQAALTIHDYRVATEAGAVLRFETIQDFAEHFALPTSQVHETLDAYHRGLTSGDPFGRPQVRELRPPYYGVRIGAALFHTQGGLKINQNAQVLRTDGRIFENLYAGGGAAEGLSGRHPKGYLSGNGLLSAVTLGYIAGSHAAAKLTQKTC